MISQPYTIWWHIYRRKLRFCCNPFSFYYFINCFGWPDGPLGIITWGNCFLYYLIIVPHVSKRDGAARMQVMLDIIGSADDYARGIRDNRIYGQQSGALTAYIQSAQNFTQNMVSWVSKVATLAAVATALLQAVATFAIAYFVAYQYDSMTLAATLFFSLVS